MEDDKRLPRGEVTPEQEKALEGVTGGLSFGPMDDVSEVMKRAGLCLGCVRKGVDCPYHDDVETIYNTYGASTPDCYKSE